MNKSKSETMKNENAQMSIKARMLSARCERLEQLALHREQDLKIVLLAFRQHLINDGIPADEVQGEITALINQVLAEIKKEGESNEEKSGD